MKPQTKKKEKRYQNSLSAPFWLCSEKQNPKHVCYKCRKQPIRERGVVGECQNRRTIYRKIQTCLESIDRSHGMMGALPWSRAAASLAPASLPANADLIPLASLRSFGDRCSVATSNFWAVCHLMNCSRMTWWRN